MRGAALPASSLLPLLLTLPLLVLSAAGGRGPAAGVLRRVPRALPPQAQQPQQHNNHRNISLLLDNLLRGYDNSVRPDFGGPPAEVEVDIMVRSMGPISEVDMTYSMDCYFRQSWVDRRLAFDSDKETLALSISMLKRIWKPDTYFYNGKQSYLHTITTPNKFVRLFRDGRVLYSSRLTIKAGCPMNLEDFPMDTQRCPLRFGSFGYTTNDVLYRWNRRRTVAIAEDMKLSQFDLIATPAGNGTDVLQSGEYSMLLVSFHLQRHMGNFLIQVYGPCVLLVVLSWVSFWLNREATADRVSLGITTVLTMTFLGLEARTDLPKVPYPTALDFFVFLSFAFIFATIIQFAVVHYFTKYGSGECYFNPEFSSDSSSDEDGWQETARRLSRAPAAAAASGDSMGTAGPAAGPSAAAGAASGAAGDGGGGSGARLPRRCPEPNLLEVIPLSEYRVPLSRPATPWPLGCLGLSCGRRERPRSTQGPTRDPEVGPRPVPRLSGPAAAAAAAAAIGHRLSASGGRPARARRKRRTPRFNSVSKIDRASRVVFPMCFLAINMFYWYSYLSRSRRILRSVEVL